VDSRLIVAIFVISAAIAAIAYWRWHSPINRGLGIAFQQVGKFLLDTKTCKVAETFFLEAAVLWFVFPLLDTIYEHKTLTDPVLRQAYIFSLFCFIIAVTLSHIGKD
jgi:hypothetical protein